MRGFLAVARREIVENRIALIGAATGSLLPVLISPLRGLRGSPAQEARDHVAYFVAGVYAIAVATALGWTFIAQEISNRRLGFFFTRPLSSGTIWWAKLCGAFVVVFGGVALVIAPTLVISGGILPKVDLVLGPSLGVSDGVLPRADPQLPSLLGIVSVSAILFLVCHAVSVAFRARSPLLLLDFFLAVLAVFLVLPIPVVFVYNWAVGALEKGFGVFSVVLLLSLLAAGFASVARGRTDIRASHRALSVTFWGIVLSAIALFWLYSSWILSARPKDMAAVAEAQAAPAGRWIIVSGKAEGRLGYEPMFLWEPGSGDFIRVGPHVGPPVFSKDGKRAAWYQWRQSGWPLTAPGLELVTAALDSPSPKALDTGISFPAGMRDWTDLPGQVLFSPSGNRIAELHKKVLSVYDLPPGRGLASARIPDAAYGSKLFFLSEDLLRVYATEDVRTSADATGEPADKLTILEFDVRGKQIERTGSTEPQGRAFPILANALGDRLLIRRSGTSKSVYLLDGRTGRTIRTLASAAPPDSVWPDFLSDGRIVVGEIRNAIARLRLFSADGSEIRVIDLGEARQVFFGGQPVPGELFVGLGPDLGGARHNMNGAIFVVDLETGASRRVGQGLYPTVRFPRLSSVDPTFLPSPGSPATRLFYGPNNALVDLNPLTGERRVILPGQAR